MTKRKNNNMTDIYFFIKLLIKILFNFLMIYFIVLPLNKISSIMYSTNQNMKISIILVIIFICTISNTQDNEQPKPQQSDVIILNNNNLQQSIYTSQDPWLLDLYAPWCGHCMQMTKEWQKLATKLKWSVKVAKIDASEYPQFNQLYGLKGFPHIVFIPGGLKNKQLFYVHKGPRTANAFQKWTLQKIKQHKRSTLQRLTDQSMWNDIWLSSNHYFFCMVFFLPQVTESFAYQQREVHLKIIGGVIKKFSHLPVKFVWAQKGDHLHVQEKFNVGQQIPSVILINPPRKRYSVMPKLFTQDGFQDWMGNIFDIKFQQYEGEIIFGNQQSQYQSIPVNTTNNEL